ncbi:hypothetical protein P872_00215 [Rhodonellum psychrophilum GCM71 = DSM 17998]|uniref:Uncharacterized protein n=1 Tax=Rhodonellum psychrophilum GCM71 = DSM 17998 TaxID=1123057 RepID=U5C150_9BACT|nr:hypothetical protein P872_00215 [Rhodonellum psychrophilum GCM71 = DSM 17998]
MGNFYRMFYGFQLFGSPNVSLRAGSVFLFFKAQKDPVKAMLSGDWRISENPQSRLWIPITGNIGFVNPMGYGSMGYMMLPSLHPFSFARE